MDQCVLKGNTVTDEGGAVSLQYGSLTMTVSLDMEVTLPDFARE